MTISVILLIALAAFPAAAQSPASFDITVDPRFELLGVMQQLSGNARMVAATEDYRARVDEHFGAFRDHSAVTLYQNLVSSSSREEATTTILIYFSNPPELALKVPNADIHYLDAPGEAEEMHRFLHELRDFARASDFLGFFRKNRDYYRTLEDAAHKTLGPINPISTIESYLGVKLAARSHYILAPLNPFPRAFINPYPLPPDNIGVKSFDVYSVYPDLLNDAFYNGYWYEPLYVFLDPSFYYFAKLNVLSPENFYGPELARCINSDQNCGKEFVITAIVEHLNRKVGRPPVTDAGRTAYSKIERRLISALTDRLDEYDARRDHYPTLWDFYPRLFAVFEETAFPERAPSRLFVPAEPKIRKASDFFDPAVTAALLRASSR